MKSPVLKKIFIATVLFASLANGCGQQSFEPVQQAQNSDAPGSMAIAPKVDLLLVVDNTGSASEIRASLQAAIQQFLGQLQAQNWDFRIAAVPLTGSASITKIAASRHDANWGAEWTPPYPGAPKTSTIPASMFVRPSQFSVTVAPSNVTQGTENGLAQIGTIVTQANTKNFFTRPEAILGIVVVTNGEDTSDGTYYITPYQTAPIATISSSVLSKIRAAKSSALADSIRLFSVVNTTGKKVSCLGDIAWTGSRYMQAAQALGGRSYNLCANQLGSVLTSLQGELKAITLNYVTRFALLSAQPNVATIKVTKHAANGSVFVVPESVGGSAGWKYLGYANVPMISEPIAMDYRSGYAIQLIGDEYKLTGSEFVSIEFLPFGISPSQ